jgi:hypothetical protein
MPHRVPGVDPARLALWCAEHLGSPPTAELFTSGCLSAVIGLRLADDREVVVKVRPGSPRIAACIKVQRRMPRPEEYDIDLNEVAGPEWIDQAGRCARDRLRAGAPEAVIGHCDWLASNLRWKGDELLVVHDWDSTAADSEAVLVGFAAALHSTVSPDEHATIEETGKFLDAYCDARGQLFSPHELQLSWAAGVWTRAYDAKYQHAAGKAVVSLSKEEARERLRRAGIG